METSYAVATLTDIACADLTATDLREEAEAAERVACYRATVEPDDGRIPEGLQIVALPDVARCGIASNSYADWADHPCATPEQVEAAILMYLNDPDEWARRN